jgi:hypothetical protein
VLTATRKSNVENNGMNVEISLPTLTAEALSGMLDDDGSDATSAIAPMFVEASNGGLDIEDIVNVVRFAWGVAESVIVEIRPSVDLANVKVNAKELVSAGPLVQRIGMAGALKLCLGPSD